MQLAVERDLSASATDFVRVVWPQIATWFGGGRLVPVEAVVATEFAKLLDMCAGIDAWHLSDGNQLRGLSSRVQWIKPGYNAWDSFTVRVARDSGAKTEYEKRAEAIKSDKGWLWPVYTVQAYVQSPRGDGPLLSVAAVPTRSLIEAVAPFVEGAPAAVVKDREVAGLRRTSNAVFAHAGWGWLADSGHNVKVWRSK